MGSQEETGAVVGLLRSCSPAKFTNNKMIGAAHKHWMG